MSSSHSLVLFSLIYSLVLAVILVIYHFIYPKKQISLLVLLLLVSLLPLISIFRPGIYESGDLSYHVMETMEFFKSLSQGNIFPVWAGDMNATYGYPAFLFTYPLPFYIASFFHLFGFTFINSVKLLLASSFFFSGFFMFLWLKKLTKEIGAFTGAILYLFAPYHLVDLHFRADIGEILAFVFLPLILFTATNQIQTKKSYWLVIEAISIAFLILSHPAVALVGLIIVSLYIIILIQHHPERLHNFLLQLFAFILGILLTGFYVIPVLYELHFTLQAFRQEVSFVKLPELLYAPWRYGLLFQGPQGQLSVSIGYIQLFIVLIAFLYFWEKRFKNNDKQFIILSFAIVFVMGFMMLEISKPLWYLIPFIKSFQFSYRLMGVMMFVISILGALTVSYINRRWLIVVICCIAIFSTILNWGNRKNIPTVTDTTLRNEIPYTATNGGGLIQAVTRWSDPKNPLAKMIPQQHIQLLKGKAVTTQLSYNLTNHIYLADMKSNTVIRENTLYFPGWTVYIDNKKIPSQILISSTPRGIISFPVSRGVHKIAVRFENTTAVIVGAMISILSVIVLLIYLLGKRYKYVLSSAKFFHYL